LEEYLLRSHGAFSVDSPSHSPFPFLPEFVGFSISTFSSLWRLGATDSEVGSQFRKKDWEAGGRRRKNSNKG